MRFSTKTVRALMIKELKDYYRNPIILIAIFFPVFFTIFYSNMFDDSLTKNVSTNSGIILSGILLPPFLIIEEKSSNTLDALMLFSINAFEFLVGKFLPYFFLSLVANIISVLLVFELSFGALLQITFVILITLLGVILIGALVGFLCRNNSEVMACVIGISIVLSIIPIIGNFNGIMAKISSLLAITNMDILLISILKGKGILNSLRSLFIMAFWVLFPIIVFSCIYKYKKLD